VDAAQFNPYLTGDMLRQFLTLLAIVTGLAAVGAPAQARVAAFDGVQMEAARERAPACEVRQLSGSMMPGDLGSFRSAKVLFCPRPRITIMIPTVQLGIDRAHE
jgi:hypothetical protein